MISLYDYLLTPRSLRKHNTKHLLNVISSKNTWLTSV